MTTDTAPPLVLGVDGGGSACRFALTAGAARHEVTLGPANFRSDPAGAVATLRDGLDQLAQMAGLRATALHTAPAFLGLAGVLTRADADRVAAALPLTDARIEDDRRSTVAGALGPADGAVLSVGTGSFLARQTGGEIAGIGGWGLPLGDEASGAWLGRGLLAAVLHARDGLRAASPLTRAILSDFGADTAAIVSFAATAAPADFARLARPLIAAAEDDDAVALDLLEQGAAYLVRGLDALGWQPGQTLCALGGVAPAYAGWLPAPLTAAKGNALDGALALAARGGPR